MALRNVWALQRMALDPYIQVHGQVIIETFKDFSLMQASDWSWLGSGYSVAVVQGLQPRAGE